MEDVAAVLQQLIQNHVATPFGEGGLGRDVPFGSGGLGMDSVSVVMLLLECEARWGVAFSAELLEKQPLTLGRLVDHFQGHTG